LPLVVASYTSEPRSRAVSPELTRYTTVVRLHGAGEQGIGEDVTPFEPAQRAFAESAPNLPLAGEWTVDSFAVHLDTLELYRESQLPRGFPTTFRRWAFESAALDLALRQAGLSLAGALGLTPRPVNFVNSPMLQDAAVTTIRQRLKRHPWLRFKLDPAPDWDEDVIGRLAATGAVVIIDLKGQYPPAAPVALAPDPDLYARLAKWFPDAWLEDPGLTADTREVLAPHLDRISWDLPVRTAADIARLPIPPRAINIKPARHGTLRRLLDVYDHCAQHEIPTYAGGMGEIGPGRGQNQYLASMFHPDAPNDIAPTAYNDKDLSADLPTSPLDPTPTTVGFRWDMSKERRPPAERHASSPGRSRAGQRLGHPGPDGARASP
jgi:L-alanine-DL-glutamate epimerase-like enolase superfamily enzyme